MQAPDDSSELGGDDSGVSDIDQTHVMDKLILHQNCLSDVVPVERELSSYIGTKKNHPSNKAGVNYAYWKNYRHYRISKNDTSLQREQKAIALIIEHPYRSEAYKENLRNMVLQLDASVPALLRNEMRECGYVVLIREENPSFPHDEFSKLAREVQEQNFKNMRSIRQCFFQENFETSYSDVYC